MQLLQNTLLAFLTTVVNLTVGWRNGIRGSALGPQFVAKPLAPDNPPLKVRFIDNIDPGGIDHQIAQLGSQLATSYSCNCHF